eukprot:g3466.t1
MRGSDWVHHLDSADPFSEHPRLRRYADLKAAPEGALGAASGIFVAEGPEALRHLLAADSVRIESLLLKRTVFERMRGVIESRRERDRERDGVGSGFKVFVSPSQRTFTEAVGYNARGALACGFVPTDRNLAWLRSELQQKDLVDADASWRLLAIDGCNNPANLGNLIRTAAALEVDAVLLSDDCADAWYRRSVRVSMGCCFRLPIVRCNLSHALAVLRDADNVETFAAVISESAAPLSCMAVDHARNSEGRERWCCVVGSEAAGICPEVQTECLRHVRIPMSKEIDSLSITTAAAIVLARLRDAASERRGTASFMRATPLAGALLLVGVVLGMSFSRGGVKFCT